MREFLVQTIIFIAGAAIGVVVPILHKQWQKVIAVVLAALLVATSLLWIGYELGRQSHFPPLSSVLIPIDATQGWQPTGVTVQRGDEITIRVVAGNWTLWRERLSPDIRNQLPDGLQEQFPEEVWLNKWKERSGNATTDKCLNCPIPDKPGGLIAQIDSSEPVMIGEENTFTAPEEGILFLRINDDRLDDNAGILAVEIKVGK